MSEWVSVYLLGNSLGERDEAAVPAACSRGNDIVVTSQQQIPLVVPISLF